MKETRNYGIDLLKIIAMLFIISFHYVYKSGYEFTELTINSFIVKVFWLFGELGVNLFMLVTGYFMINRKIKIKKIILLLFEVEFYYIICQIIAIKLEIISFDFNFKDIVMLFFPVIFNRYWFITVYILIYIMSPYLNIFLKSIDKKTYIKFLITVLILWSVIPTIFGVFNDSTEKTLYYSRLIWLIIIYCVGAYINLYKSEMPKKFLIAILSFFSMIVSIIIIHKYNGFFNNIGTYEVAYLWGPNNVPMFLLSVALFQIFLNINIYGKKIISVLASTTLGIYLLHDGSLAWYIWQTLFKANEHLHSRYSICYILISAIVVFIIGAVIDLIRQIIEKYTIKRLLDLRVCYNLYDKVQKWSDKIIK